MGKGRRDRITGIGELQLQVLDVLSGLGEATVYDVMERFPAEGRPRYSTVKTVLSSLEKKGLATHRTEGRTFVFRALQSPSDVREQMVRDMVSRAFGGSPGALVSTLLNAQGLTPEDLTELKELLEQRGAEERDG